jgi:hypothetical protein
MTTLPAEGFLVEDVLDLSHGRGAEDRGTRLVKMSKKIPIAGVPTCAVSVFMRLLSERAEGRKQKTF